MVKNTAVPGMFGTKTNQDVAALLSDGQTLTPAGEALAAWLDQTRHFAHYVAMVLNTKSLTAAQYFSVFVNYAAELWQAYQETMSAAAQTTTQPTESAAIEIKRPPKLVDRNGYITEAGITLATILIEAYHGGKLPATDASRAFVAHILLMRQTPQTFFRNNPRYAIPLTVVAVQLAQTKLGALREELDRIKAKTTPRKKNTPPAAKPGPASTGLVGLDGKPLTEGKAVKLAESAADDIPEDQLLRVRAQISRMIAAES